MKKKKLKKEIKFLKDIIKSFHWMMEVGNMENKAKKFKSPDQITEDLDYGGVEIYPVGKAFVALSKDPGYYPTIEDLKHLEKPIRYIQELKSMDNMEFLIVTGTTSGDYYDYLEKLLEDDHNVYLNAVNKEVTEMTTMRGMNCLFNPVIFSIGPELTELTVTVPTTYEVHLLQYFISQRFPEEYDDWLNFDFGDGGPYSKVFYFTEDCWHYYDKSDETRDPDIDLKRVAVTDLIKNYLT